MILVTVCVCVCVCCVMIIIFSRVLLAMTLSISRSNRVWLREKANRHSFVSSLWGQLTRENIFPLSPFAPENLVSRCRFDDPVPREPAQFSQHRVERAMQSPSVDCRVGVVDLHCGRHWKQYGSCQAKKRRVHWPCGEWDQCLLERSTERDAGRKKIELLI